MKRFLYLLIIIVSIAAVVGIGYFIRYRQSVLTTTTSENTGVLPTTTSPSQRVGILGANASGTTTTPALELKSERISLAANLPTRDFFVDNTNSILVVERDGQIVRIQQGQVVSVSSAVIERMLSAAISPDGKKVLVVFGSAATPQSSVFDVVQKTWQPLPSDIRRPIWAPDSKNITYIASSSVSQGTVVRSLDITAKSLRAQDLVRLNAQDQTIAWTKTKLIFNELPSASVSAPVVAFDPKIRSVQLLKENKNGLLVAADTTSDNMIVLQSSGSVGGKLSSMDIQGNAVELPILTMPSKCTGYSINPPAPAIATGTAKTSSTRQTRSTPPLPATRYIICAVPKNSQTFLDATLPDDVLKRKIFTDDTIVSIKPDQGDMRAISKESPAVFDGDNLKIFNNSLFFINRLDEKLYAMALSL